MAAGLGRALKVQTSPRQRPGDGQGVELRSQLARTHLQRCARGAAANGKRRTGVVHRAGDFQRGVVDTIDRQGFRKQRRQRLQRESRHGHLDSVRGCPRVLDGTAHPGRGSRQAEIGNRERACLHLGARQRDVERRFHTDRPCDAQFADCEVTPPQGAALKISHDLRGSTGCRRCRPRTPGNPSTAATADRCGVHRR